MDRYQIVLCPRNLLLQALTVDVELVQFDAERPLVLRVEAVAQLVVLGPQEDAHSCLLGTAALIVHADVKGERLVVQVLVLHLFTKEKQA